MWVLILVFESALLWSSHCTVKQRKVPGDGAAMETFGGEKLLHIVVLAESAITVYCCGKVLRNAE